MLTKRRGCVSPATIQNVKDKTGGDIDWLDGYEDLPADIQAKVKRAYDQGHVDDDDWRGVSDCPELCWCPNPSSNFTRTWNVIAPV
jgi:hypothetical protein